jgi:4-alpha-glucanotransferase
LIPWKTPASEGTYVRYPYEDLLRIVALESTRQHCVIIGEDLGTVGDEVHDALHDHGMLSYRLLYFERDRRTRRYHPPARYPELALAAATTHDLPTVRGFWDMHDIDTRAALGLYASKNDERAAREERTAAIDLIEEALGSAVPEYGLATGEERLKAVYGFLARTSSALVSVSLDDALGLLEQQNLPGVVEGHPNWRRRYPLSVEQMREHELIRELAKMFRKHGR